MCNNSEELTSRKDHCIHKRPVLVTRPLFFLSLARSLSPIFFSLAAHSVIKTNSIFRSHVRFHFMCMCVCVLCDVLLFVFFSSVGSVISPLFLTTCNVMRKKASVQHILMAPSPTNSTIRNLFARIFAVIRMLFGRLFIIRNATMHSGTVQTIVVAVATFSSDICVCVCVCVWIFASNFFCLLCCSFHRYVWHLTVVIYHKNVERWKTSHPSEIFKNDCYLAGLTRLVCVVTGFRTTNHIKYARAIENAIEKNVGAIFASAYARLDVCTI